VANRSRGINGGSHADRTTRVGYNPRPDSISSGRKEALRTPALSDPECTTALLARVRGGDAMAREQLLARYLPRLRRWAHGRLPRHARHSTDTDDLVQVTLVRALNRLHEFEPQREGAFLAYLRTILLNAVREEIRRVARNPSTIPLDESLSRVEQDVGVTLLTRYEAALGRLGEVDREAVILRVEFGYSHREIAEAIDSPSANAARMTVTRALVRLAELMQ
jgi:RNA polymerase sigma factor (sigma-70 family)